MLLNIENMLDSIQRITIGISQTAGTGDFSVTDDTLVGWKPFNDANHPVPDGTLVPFHRYYLDRVTAGFEAGHATYHAASGELRDKVIEYSSHIDGVSPITWTTDDSIVVAGITRSMMTATVRMHSQLGWNVPPLFVWTGRSNSGYTPGSLANMVNFKDFLDHYSTDQIQGDYDPADLAWRPLDMDEKGSQTNSGDLPYIGTRLRQYIHPTEGVQEVAFYQDSIPTSTAVGELWVDTDSDDGNGRPLTYTAESIGADQITAGEWELTDDADWLPNANPYYLAAGFVCMLLGVRGKCVPGYKILQIDDEDGWVYNPTSANSVAGTLKTQLDAAIAADADLTAAGVTHPHFMMMSGMTGGSDGLGMDTLEYGLLMDDIIKKFYDPDAWDLCKRNFTRMLITDKVIGPIVEDANPDFEGQKLACEWNPDKCTLIPTTGLTVYEHTYDTIHWTEAGTAELAGRIVNAIATSGGYSNVGSAALKAYREKFSGPVFGITIQADSDTAPAAVSGRFNAAQTHFLISKTLTATQDPNITHEGSLQFSWIRGLTKNNPLEESAGIGAATIVAALVANISFTVEGPVEDRGDHFAIPCGNVVQTTPTGAAFFAIINWRGWYGYGQCASLPTLPFKVTALEQANETGTAVLNYSESQYHGFVTADQNGLLKRFKQDQFYRPNAYLTTAGAATTQRSVRMAFVDFETTGNVIAVEAEVYMQDDGDATNIAWATYRRTFRWTGSAWSANDTTHVTTVFAGDAPPDEPPSWDWIYASEGGAHRIILQINNVEANWHCNFRVRAYPIEQV